MRFDGQVAVFDLRARTAPCYHCLFPEDGEAEEMRCAMMGVFAPLVGIIGTMQAAEALKLLTRRRRAADRPAAAARRLAMEWRSIRLKSDPACPVCGELKN